MMPNVDTVLPSKILDSHHNNIITYLIVLMKEFKIVKTWGLKLEFQQLAAIVKSES